MTKDEIINAIKWSLKQEVEVGGKTIQVTLDKKDLLVDKVREYFNVNKIEYDTFSYKTLQPFFIVLD